LNRELPVILRKLLQYLFVIIGCLHLLGGPYSIIQLYAWANMVVTYSQDTSLTEAVADTLSGEKPCDICKKIVEVKSSENHDEEKPQAPSPASPKLFHDLFPPTLAGLKEPSSQPVSRLGFPAVAESIPACPSGPPAPPPRC
jgi:hypothetical protein